MGMCDRSPHRDASPAASKYAAVPGPMTAAMPPQDHLATTSQLACLNSAKRMWVVVPSIVAALICAAPPAIAANFDGNWSMVAETTRGHCGTIELGLGVTRGRIYSTA